MHTYPLTHTHTHTHTYTRSHSHTLTCIYLFVNKTLYDILGSPLSNRL